MGRETDIGWTDSTINPTSGCDGCELYKPGPDGEDTDSTCYAKDLHLQRLAKSYPALYAPRFDEVRMIPGRMQKAADWPDLTGRERLDKPWMSGRPRHIFVGDMGDVFSKAVTEEYIKREVLGAAESKSGQRHIWQWLTKRPDRLADLAEKWGGLPDNVIAMTTITNQQTADVRIPHLRRVKCRTRAVSAEPLLGPVDLKLRGATASFPQHITSQGHAVGMPMMIHQVIVGGESGGKARPMHPGWARSIRDQCLTFGVPFFFKQWGRWRQPIEGEEYDTSRGRMGTPPAFIVSRNGTVHCFHGEDIICGVAMIGVSKAKAGRLLDGIEHNGMPEVRQ